MPRDRNIGAVPRRSATGAEFYRASWALVVGIDHYEHIEEHELDYAERDAREIAALLPALGFPRDQVRLLLASANALTPGAIWEALDELGDVMDPEDRLLVYWSGHGVSVEVKGRYHGYLLLPGSRVPAWPTRERPHLSRPPHAAVEMATLRSHIDPLVAKHKLMLLDTCFSGFLTRRRALRPQDDRRIEQWTREPVLQVLTAGTAGQTATELQRYGHGVFTYAVLQALRGNAGPGDGLVSFSDLAGYVKRRVAEEADQDPQYGTLDGDE